MNTALLAATEPSVLQSVFFSLISGLVGLGAAGAAIYVFFKKEGKSGWQVAMMMSFGSILIALPVMNNFSLTWTEDGKPVVNFTLNAILDAVREAKQEAVKASQAAAAAKAESQSVATRLGSTESKIAQVVSGVQTMSQAQSAYVAQLESLTQGMEKNTANFMIYNDPQHNSLDAYRLGSLYDPTHKPENLEDIFKHWDTNKDGKLDEQELRQPKSKMLPPAPAPQAPAPAAATPNK